MDIKTARNDLSAPMFGRRDALGLIAGLAAFGPDMAQAQQQTAARFDRAAFLQASSLATGFPAEQLTGLADSLFKVFETQGPAILQLSELARATPPANLAGAVRGTPMEPVARALAAAWYTGTVGSGASSRLLSYEDALAWKAVGYEAVPGMCAGNFGFWSEPPATP